jgi:type IV pilus assembly protein PilC
MVAAGESGGMLDVMLSRLAIFLEKSDLLARKVRGAMVYPAVIMGVAAVCVVVLLWKVIPIFAGMFASSGLELPGPTQVVIGLSQLLTAYWWLLLLVGLVLTVGGRQAYATAAGQLAIDRAVLRLPALGDLIRKSAVSRFTRTLGTLIGSGVGILEGLDIAARTVGNREMHDAIMQSRSSIASGDTIAAPLQRSGVFPPMVVSMIAVGEQTGGLDEMLAKVADFYDAEVDVAVGTMLSLLEPVMIVLLGVVVGGMLIAMYLPIFDMVNAVR